MSYHMSKKTFIFLLLLIFFALENLALAKEDAIETLKKAAEVATSRFL